MANMCVKTVCAGCGLEKLSRRGELPKDWADGSLLMKSKPDASLTEVRPLCPECTDKMRKTVEMVQQFGEDAQAKKEVA